MSNQQGGAPRCRAMVKATNTIITLLCLLAAAGLAVCLSLERQARVKLDRENAAWRQQLSQRDKLRADNQQLSNLVAQAEASPSQPRQPVAALSETDERAKEIERLRAEVKTLRQQSQELESLRADTRQVRAGQPTGVPTLPAGQAANGSNPTAGDGSQLEILQAEYWTDHTNLDVAAELRERIRDGSLKAIASNNLKGDPEFGQVKHLTVVYRFGGATLTNQFREGDFVVLPAE
jgi:hypothetical protein